jgi:hypothetical protein
MNTGQVFLMNTSQSSDTTSTMTSNSGTINRNDPDITSTENNNPKFSTNGW